MSAFIVSEAHINYLVNAAMSRGVVGDSGLSWYVAETRHELRPGQYEQAERVGQMLLQENVRSVDYRYPSDAPRGAVGTFRHRSVCSVDAVQTLKACHGLEYQSCNHPGWEESEACAFLVALARRASQHVPGYDEAAWAIADSPRAVRKPAVSPFCSIVGCEQPAALWGMCTHHAALRTCNGCDAAPMAPGENVPGAMGYCEDCALLADAPAVPR